MTDKPTPTPNQIVAAEDCAERERLAAELAAILQRLGIVVVGPRPGFASRRRDRMLRPPQSRSEG